MAPSISLWLSHETGKVVSLLRRNDQSSTFWKPKGPWLRDFITRVAFCWGCSGILGSVQKRSAVRTVNLESRRILVDMRS